MKGGLRVKKFFAALMVFVLALSVSVTAFAAEDDYGIELYANNFSSASGSLTISSTGKATAKYSYSGLSGKFKSAKIVTKIQKKVGLIWITVGDGSWTDTSTSLSGSKSHSVQLSSTGTYRAHIVFTFSGSGGSDDKVTKNYEKTYK